MNLQKNFLRLVIVNVIVTKFSVIVGSYFELKSSYIGCFQFIRWTRVKRIANIKDCLDICRNETNNFIAIGNGKQCSCVERMEAAVASSRCDVPCENGNACGGKRFYSVYKAKPREKHHGIMYHHSGSYEKWKLLLPPLYNLEMRAHFCLEMNTAHFSMDPLQSLECTCFNNSIISGFFGLVLKCDRCLHNENEICRCYDKHWYELSVLYSTRPTYEFQRGQSTYSHCGDENYKVETKCSAACDEGWKGDSCRERDCTRNNGGCGNETKYIESTVNGYEYVECICPFGTAVQAGNPMLVVCKNFSILSQFVILQQPGKPSYFNALAVSELEVYEAHCGILNGRCGEQKCEEQTLGHLGPIIIECTNWVDTKIVEKKPFNGCFKNVQETLQLVGFRLSYQQCETACNSNLNSSFAVMQAGFKCLCGQYLLVSGQMPINYCIIGRFDSNLVFDECYIENYFCETNLHDDQFNFSVIPPSKEDATKEWTSGDSPYNLSLIVSAIVTTTVFLLLLATVAVVIVWKMMKERFDSKTSTSSSTY
ncbi:hypothetical protein HELRODRAFT_176388 [Helobdella robusta]|uniref:WSC domain-containing protein n=1 Tax=Helobdella robusta TaxID=6412 RepID=T1FAG9_HELRO|nr:hypothetical protein HELRODRAFT_176388 [Helobdella robusta]ESO00078.1 hypothetical protein HELRODRAFT_176388 [Helobdella robusta]